MTSPADSAREIAPGAVRVGAVILAAGASSRMGEPKALLRHADGRTFLRASAEALRDAGCAPIWVVLGGHREAIEAELSRIQTAVCLTPIVNPAPERGQASSMALGLRAAKDAGCALAAIALVDQPVTPAAIVEQLLTFSFSEPEAIHIPVHRGERGHPAIFPTALASLLERAAPEQSARELIALAGMATREHPVDAPEVLLDLDTPAELAAWREQERAGNSGRPSSGAAR